MFSPSYPLVVCIDERRWENVGWFMDGWREGEGGQKREKKSSSCNSLLFTVNGACGRRATQAKIKSDDYKMLLPFQIIIIINCSNNCRNFHIYRGTRARHPADGMAFLVRLQSFKYFTHVSSVFLRCFVEPIRVRWCILSVKCDLLNPIGFLVDDDVAVWVSAVRVTTDDMYTAMVVFNTHTQNATLYRVSVFDSFPCLEQMENDLTQCEADEKCFV